MIIQKRERMTHVAFRIPNDIRAKAKQFATQNGSNESELYRSIIVDFFSRNRKQNVDKKEIELEHK